MRSSPSNEEFKQEPLNSPGFETENDFRCVLPLNNPKEPENTNSASEHSQTSNITPSTSIELEGKVEVKKEASSLTELSKYLLPFSSKPNLNDFSGGSNNIFSTIKHMESSNNSSSITQETVKSLTPEASNDVKGHNTASNEDELIPTVFNMLDQLGFQFISTNQSEPQTQQSETLTTIKQEEINPFSSIQNTNNNSNLFFYNSNSGQNSPNSLITIKQESTLSNLNNNMPLLDYPRSYHSLSNLANTSNSGHSSPYSPTGLNTLNRFTPTRTPPVLPDDVNMYGFDLLPKEYQSPSQVQSSSSNRYSTNLTNTNNSHSNTPQANSPNYSKLASSHRREVISSPSKRTKFQNSDSITSNLQPANTNNNRTSESIPFHLDNLGTSNSVKTSNAPKIQQATNKVKKGETSTVASTKNIPLTLSKGSSNINIKKKLLSDESSTNPKHTTHQESHENSSKSSTTKSPKSSQQSKQAQNPTANRPNLPITKKPARSSSKTQASNSSGGKSIATKKAFTESHIQEHESRAKYNSLRDSLPEDELTLSQTTNVRKPTKSVNKSIKQKAIRTSSRQQKSHQDDDPITFELTNSKSKRKNRIKHRPQDSEYTLRNRSRSGRKLKPLGAYWENARGYEVKPVNFTLK